MEIGCYLGLASSGQEIAVYDRCFTDTAQPFIESLLSVFAAQVIQSQMKAKHSQNAGIGPLTDIPFDFRLAHPFGVCLQCNFIKQVFFFRHVFYRGTGIKQHHSQNKQQHLMWDMFLQITKNCYKFVQSIPSVSLKAEKLPQQRLRGFPYDSNSQHAQQTRSKNSPKP